MRKEEKDEERDKGLEGKEGRGKESEGMRVHCWWKEATMSQVK